MSLAVLPFNAAEGTSPALGRQLSNFLADSLTAFAGIEIQKVSFLTPIEQDGQQRAMFINIQELMDPAQVRELFNQSQVDHVMDGLLTINGDDLDLTMRFFQRDVGDVTAQEDYKFTKAELIPKLKTLIERMAQEIGVQLPPEFQDNMEVGTESADTFVKFLEGYDSIAYIQGSNGAVSKDFNPQSGMDLFLEALEEDVDFLGPYESCIQLCRMCAQLRVGTFEMCESTLLKLQQKFPEDFRAAFALGEVYQAVGNASAAGEWYEKAIAIAPEEGSLYLRLALAQLAQGMPVNAERNLKKAMEVDPNLFEAADQLAAVLIQQGRAHEAPGVWREFVSRHPQSGPARVKLAMAQAASGDEAEAEKTFETALAEVDEKIFVKRFYAPVLAAKGDHDRAMDFYEDCLEETPNDIPLLLEYARTLQSADREFEVPQVLKTALGSNPDPDTRAQTLAWLIELEQPKRVEAVEVARLKMEEGDFESAVKELRPMKNWLGDYWKLWAILSSALNKLEIYDEAEQASKTLLGFFPGCEPAYGELVESLTKQGKTEEAAGIMRYAASQMPQSLGVHVNLALALRRDGQVEEARALGRQIREAVGPNEELEPIFAEIES